MFFLYILYSYKNGQLYVDQTNNLGKRIKENLAGKNFSTKNNLPLVLIHSESYKTRSGVMKREKFLKNLYRSKEKSRILKNFLSDGSSKL